LGNTYLSLVDYNVVVQIDRKGILYVLAGNGLPGYAGDNGPATSASLNEPCGLAVDANNNLFIADYKNSRIRKVSHGIITTIAGTGVAGPPAPGDQPATEAEFNGAAEIALDSGGNIYVADTFNLVIRKISNGIVTTIAGAGFNGNGLLSGPATSTTLYTPVGVAVDAQGNVYFSEFTGNIIGKISNGMVTIVAGSFGNAGHSGDGGPANAAELSWPGPIAIDTFGNVFVGDLGNSVVRKISNGTISTVAGNGLQGFSGDGGPAIAATLNLGQFTGEIVVFTVPIAVDFAGDLFISDLENYRLRKVSGGIITNVAGDGKSGYDWGDGGAATSASIYGPVAVAATASGNVYITDSGDNKIRMVSNGIITTVAGNGMAGYSGDGGPATSAQLNIGGGCRCRLSRRTIYRGCQ
jgi:hypothetical protein